MSPVTPTLREFRLVLWQHTAHDLGLGRWARGLGARVIVIVLVIVIVGVWVRVKVRFAVRVRFNVSSLLGAV